jgi:peptidoglycan/LPS O-acetylase OafA/YrhL
VKAENIRRLDIQVIRGICVMGVVLFHLKPNFFPNGYLGVDSFFVISGFVVFPMILKIFENTRFMFIPSKMLLFYKVRFFRLAPALGVVLLCTTMIIFLVGPVQDLRFFSAQGIAAIFLLSNVQAARLSGNNYFQPNPNALLHTWSLSVEEQIYVLFPIMMLFATFLLRKRLRIFPIIVLVSCYLMYFLLLRGNLYTFLDLTPGQLFYSPIFRLWEFALGAFVAVQKRRAGIMIYSYISYTLFILIIFSTLDLGVFGPEIVCLITSLLLVANSDSQTSNLVLKALVWLGDRSYSIYLVHLPVTYIAYHSPIFLGLNSVVLEVASLTLILLLGHLVWRFVESRFRARKLDLFITSWSRAFMIFTICPLLMLALLRFGSTNYFGLTKEPQLQGTISCTEVGKYGECKSQVAGSVRSILLMGDSHAAAISQTFVKTLNLSGINAIVMSGRGCQTIGKADTSGDCAEYRLGALHYLMANPGTEVVIFQRSSSIQNLEPREDYLLRIYEGIREISNFASALTVIGPNPEFPSGNSQGKFFDLFERDSIFPRSKMLQSSFQDDDFYKVKLNDDKIKYLTSSGLFCSDKACKYKANNSLLFWDENHVSLEGAKVFSPLLENIVRNFKKPRI